MKFLAPSILFFLLPVFTFADDPKLSFVTSHAHGGAATAETLAYDPGTQRLFVSNARERRADMLDISDPQNPKAAGHLSAGGPINCVAAKNGLVAIAVESAPTTDPGFVRFFHANGTPHPYGDVPVGAVPDMLTFSPDGSTLLVANEGEARHGVDPEGSVSILDLTPEKVTVRTASFESFNDQRAELIAKGVRLFPGISVARDLEPEYIAVAPDGSFAFVALQEANAFARVDIRAGTITGILPLGTLDHSLPGQGLDGSDRDGGANIRNWPVEGMFMPDTIKACTIGGRTYFVGACEGDHRGELKRLKDLDLNPDVFPTARLLQSDKAIGRLKVSTLPTDADPNGDGKLERLRIPGTRGFAIWDAAGTRVFASGDTFERITAQRVPRVFNASNDDRDTDKRSDDKGPEPEAVAVVPLRDRVFALIGLERTGGIALYDITEPAAARFIDYVTTRDPAVAPSSSRALGLGPESILTVPEGVDAAWVYVANELSGTTEVFRLAF